MNGYINDDLVKLLINSHAFALCRTDDNIAKYTDIVEYSQYIIDSVQYSLLRKVRNAHTELYRFIKHFYLF